MEQKDTNILIFVILFILGMAIIIQWVFYFSSVENIWNGISYNNHLNMQNIEKAKLNISNDMDYRLNKVKDNLLVLRDGITLPDGRFVIDIQKQQDTILANRILDKYSDWFNNQDIDVKRVEVSGKNNDEMVIVFAKKRNETDKKVMFPNGTLQHFNNN